MERKTRSGKVTVVTPTPAAAKKKGRKKKSEIEEQLTVEPQPSIQPVPVRRSTRGRNLDNSHDNSRNESLTLSITETDDSNASLVVTDTSMSIDEDSKQNDPKHDLEQDPSESLENKSSPEARPEDNSELAEAHAVKADPEIYQVDLQPQVLLQRLSTLEEKMSHVVLEEVKKESETLDLVPNIETDVQMAAGDQVEEAGNLLEAGNHLEAAGDQIESAEDQMKPVEDQPQNEELDIKADDIEMKEIEESPARTPDPPQRDPSPKPVEAPEVEVFQQAPSEVQEAEQPVIQPTNEEITDPFSLFDFEDEVPFVRRSRRLQSIHTEPNPMKLENITPTPVPPPVVETPVGFPEAFMDTKEETPLNSTQTLETPEIKPEPIIPPLLSVSHTDERLKNYETIRDNIYSKKSDKKVCKVNKTMKCDCTITEEEVRNGELGCQHNCINRLLYIECGLKCRCGEYCDNQQFQRYGYSGCSVFDSGTVKGFGIRADEDIPAETFIIEYVGEVLDNKQFEKRAKKYSENKNIHYYFMALKSNAIIDATKKGNISRFINHSCDPNAETQKWTVNGELRVGFFSRKDIKKGEEITFDYQYQRYGKEAQKCYCGSENCRGWIGENPMDEEAEEEEEVAESPDADDSKSKKAKGRKARKTKVEDKSKPEVELSSEPVEGNEIPAVEAVVRPSPKKRETAAKKLEDLEIKGEINDLMASGLKNRANTIRLSRLIVRAKNVETRSSLLKILINGEMPCRRLFLDYNGLNLLHNWMIDIKIDKSSIPDLELCIEIMNALEILPITNKTVLKTSKVIDRVEKWKNLDLEKKKKKNVDGEKKKMTKEEKKQAKAEKKKNKGVEKKEESMEGPLNQENLSAEAMKENIDISQLPDDNTVDELTILKMKVKKVASELLEKWEDLKEDFKIPKKQKQEIMIEHEREADDWGKGSVPRGESLNTDRYKNRFGDDTSQSGGNRSFSAPYKKQFDPIVSKHQRRQMFEMKVAQFDTEKRMMMLHENNCTIFGLNPAMSSPLDVPVRVNRVTGEYNTIDGRVVPPPPNHYQFKYEPFALSTNPDDYYLPHIDLPEHWRFALDEFGRIYYYHEKIRQPQWEAPIKFAPLKINNEAEYDSPDSDESTTDTEDSEEEELLEMLEMLKRKKVLPPAQQQNPLILATTDPNAEDDDLEKKITNNMMKNPIDQPMKLSQLPQKRLKKKKRHGLISMQFIRPRTEADKIYGRAESKRYKEVKEKLRQKKRRILKGDVGPGDSSDDEDDDIALNDSIESQRFVDELDILEKSEIDRSKIKKVDEKKVKKSKPVVVDLAEVKRQFLDEIKKEIAKFLQPYREESCENGKITSDVDFNSLVNKLTYSVLSKETKHCQSTNSVLKATDSVKAKTKEYIKKYMGKFSGPYQRKEDEQDYASILNKY